MKIGQQSTQKYRSSHLPYNKALYSALADLVKWGGVRERRRGGRGGVNIPFPTGLTRRYNRLDQQGSHSFHRRRDLCRTSPAQVTVTWDTGTDKTSTTSHQHCPHHGQWMTAWHTCILCNLLIIYNKNIQTQQTPNKTSKFHQQIAAQKYKGYNFVTNYLLLHVDILEVKTEIFLTFSFSLVIIIDQGEASK